jgi:hypothetical protein
MSRFGSATIGAPPGTPRDVPAALRAPPVRHRAVRRDPDAETF